MNKEIVNKVLDRINEKISDKECNFSKENFKLINAVKSDKKIVFVDGGQAELIKAVDFSLQFIRVVGLVFQNGEKIETKMNEFFVLINSVEENEDIRYETEMFSVKGDLIDNISLNSLDVSIRKGKERGEISEMGNIIRRFSELRLAKEMCDNDIVVIDGNLRAMVKGEQEYLDELDKGVVCGLAKTSRLFMEKGGCLLSSLNEAGGEEAWYYPLKERSVVKLHKSSEYVFEFNINKLEKQEEVLSTLAGCSNDAVFPGYPYGLLMVDKIARVSNQEKNFLLTLFKARAGKDWKKITFSVNSLNSHDVLDNV